MDFTQAEEKFKQLKAKFIEGKFSEAKFKSQLAELMVQDEDGNWWMIGYETERWYRNNGTDWVQADPPREIAPEPTYISDWSAMFWGTLGWVIGGAIGGWVYWSLDILSAFGGVIAGAIGGLAMALVLRSEKILPDWKSAMWIILGWTIGFGLGWPIGEALTEASGAAVGGAIGGLIGWGITSRFMPGISNWKSALWITLAWAISAAIGWIIARQIQFNIDGEIGWPVGIAISGAIAGFVTIWQIRKR